MSVRRREMHYPCFSKIFTADLNTICHLLALLGAHHIFHVSRVRVNLYYVTKIERKILSGILIIIKVSCF